MSTTSRSGTRWCLDFSKEEIEQIYAAVDRVRNETRSSQLLTAHWMRTTLLAKAAEINRG